MSFIIFIIYRYNSPEISNSDTYYGEDADLFASGCVLFQMVMNSAPFKSAQSNGNNFNSNNLISILLHYFITSSNI